MNLSDAAALQGKTLLVNMHEFRIPMKVLDVKSSYGEFRFKVTPVGGTGEAWISEQRLTEKEISDV